jgi:hypothetical protein
MVVAERSCISETPALDKIREYFLWDSKPICQIIAGDYEGIICVV